MPLRVLIDLLFYTGRRGGTETYAREIIERLPDVVPDSQFVALVNRAGEERVRAFFPGEVDVVEWVGADRALWAMGEILAVNHRARRLRADVIWSPANFAPIGRSRARRVTTTHDVTYHTARGRGPERIIAAASSLLMARSARTSDAIITGSHAAKAAVVEHMGVEPDSITVIPHGTNPPPVSGDPWGELEHLGIRPGRQIVLSTGNRLPHKNFGGLLRAAAAMDEARPLIVIPGGGMADPLRALVKDLALEGDVVLPGWVTPSQLEALYAQASLYVCPSLAEGFGLPVIDAMARGCVVLANDIPVLHEVGGDVAIYVDARSPERLSAAVRSALREDQSQRRAAGRRRTADYTWDRSAIETARVIERAAVAR